MAKCSISGEFCRKSRRFEKNRQLKCVQKRSCAKLQALTCGDFNPKNDLSAYLICDKLFKIFDLNFPFKMIHVSIPSTEEKCERFEDNKRYQVYNLHLNGAYHSSSRYSTLYSLHEKLLETFGHRLNVEFPPKKFWTMDANAINQRREQLTKYFHGGIGFLVGIS